LPEDSNSPQNERNPVPNNKIEENFKKVEGKIPQDLPENFNLTILKEGNSEILGKLQEDKQTFEEKIKEIVANVTELQEQNSEFLGKLQDDKQEFKDKVNELVANLTKLQEQSSESLNKLQDDKRKFDGQIKEIVTQQDSREKLNFTAPQEENSELLEKLRDDKQKFDDKIKELKDNIQSQQQNRTTKRALTVSLNEDSVISILLGGPSEIVAAFKQKVSETEEDAKELLEKFISSFDGNSDILGNLNNAVNDLVKANLSDSEFASAASSCFEAQEDAISNLVKLTGE
jgi:DNA repair exonuclease SbcCD ATPase subunit